MTLVLDLENKSESLKRAHQHIVELENQTEEQAKLTMGFAAEKEELSREVETLRAEIRRMLDVSNNTAQGKCITILLSILIIGMK